MARKRNTGWNPNEDPEVQKFLGLFQQMIASTLVPRRLHREQAAYFMNCSIRELTLLVEHGLLSYLGEPDKNQDRYVHGPTLFRKMDDEEWMSKATRIIFDYNRQRNAKAREKAEAKETENDAKRRRPRGRETE